MKKIILFSAGLLLVGVGCGPYQITKTAPAAPNTPNQATEQTDTTSTTTPTQPVSTVSPTTTIATPANGRIKIFFIAMDDGGKSGKPVGCGDSVVGVDQIIDPPGTDPLTSALTALFKEKNNYYGESGLYNSLNESNLQIKNISEVDGSYTVELTGAPSLGGSCDDPRFYSQIMETIQQFPAIKKAEVFINGKKLEDIVSERG